MDPIFGFVDLLNKSSIEVLDNVSSRDCLKLPWKVPLLGHWELIVDVCALGNPRMVGIAGSLMMAWIKC